MNADPQIPGPEPVVPRDKLWISLSIPPVATVAGNAGAALISKSSGGQLIFAVPIIITALVLGLSFMFFHAITQRYRGISVAFLYISYLLGQAIICLALWFGSCLLFMS